MLSYSCVHWRAVSNGHKRIFITQYGVRRRHHQLKCFGVVIVVFVIVVVEFEVEWHAEHGPQEEPNPQDEEAGQGARR